MDPVLKKLITDAFPKKLQKYLHSFPVINRELIGEEVISWTDSSTRYGYMVFGGVDPINLEKKLIGLLFEPPRTEMLGPYKMCDLCACTQYSKDVSFWIIKNRVNKLKVHGFHICTDLQCQDVLKGKVKRIFPPSPTVESLTVDEKIQRYRRNLEKILAIISEP